MSNLVAIVGRPNVGKSTFFNRLVGGRQAIVDEVAGVTRDRQYGKSLWNGIEFNVVDTGGYAVNSDDIFEGEIRKQVMAAISEADVIVFMVDVTSGITDFDDTVAGILRKSKKKIFLVANKVDNNERIADSGEFYAFGLGDVYCISSANGSGTGELLDDIVKEFKDNPPLETLELPRFAVVGKPNVGKSSLVNALLGEDRSIVTPIAGTTRDSIYTRFNSFGFDFYLVDTAGVRKKGKVHEDLEFYSVMRAIRAIENCDVCLLMIDAEEGFTAQDVNIFSLAEKNNKGVVVIVNKWDLVEKDHKSAKVYEDAIRQKLEPFTDVPIIFTSVKEKQRVIKALEMAVKVYENRTKKIKTSVLNDHMLKVIEHTPPPALKGKHIKIKFITQLPTYYPSFVFFCNLPQYVKDPYYRFIENKMREQYDFHGVPIKIYFRKK